MKSRISNLIAAFFISVPVFGSVAIASGISPVGAWLTEQEAGSVCTEEGKAKVQAQFRNTEPKDSGLTMTVRASIHGTPMEPPVAIVAPGEKKQFGYTFNSDNVLPGIVTFDLDWTDGREGTDKREANFGAVGPCSPPVDTPVPEPTPAPSPAALKAESICRADGLILIQASLRNLAGPTGQAIMVTANVNGKPMSPNLREAAPGETVEFILVMDQTSVAQGDVTFAYQGAEHKAAFAAQGPCQLPTPVVTLLPVQPVVTQPAPPTVQTGIGTGIVITRTTETVLARTGPDWVMIFVIAGSAMLISGVVFRKKFSLLAAKLAG